MTESYFSDQALQEAAKLVRDAMLRSLPEPEECEDAFSDGFYAKMEKLIRKHQRRQSARKWMMCVAAVFVAAMIGITSWLAVDVRACESVLNWIRIVGENYFEYRHPQNGPLEELTEELPQYELTWLPKGFELVDGHENLASKSEYYLNAETGSVVIFGYYTSRGSAGSIKIFDFEMEVVPEKITINGCEGEFFGKGSTNTNNLIWEDEETGIMFIIDSDMKKSVMRKIAKNVKPVN